MVNSSYIFHAENEAVKLCRIEPFLFYSILSRYIVLYILDGALVVHFNGSISDPNSSWGLQIWALCYIDESEYGSLIVWK